MEYLSPSQAIPPPPSDEDTGRPVKIDNFWKLLRGPEVGLTSVEAEIVLRWVQESLMNKDTAEGTN